jgi:hypothetical protein
MTDAEPMWPTMASLYIEAIAPGGASLGGATGFVVERSDGALFLLTARHVFSGRHDVTKKILHSSGATPQKIKINHPRHWLTVPEVMTQELAGENDDPLYLEDPSIIDFENADVAALPLARPGEFSRS